MKVGRTVKKIIKPHIDAPTWVDLPFLSNSITSFVNLTKSLIIPEKATYQETFAEAASRLNLTEEDLNKRLKQFLRIQLFFLVLLCFSVAYFLLKIIP